MCCPSGFHRIRQYGLLANGTRKDNLALAREFLHVVRAQAATFSKDEQAGVLPDTALPAFGYRHCGHAMTILQSFMRGQAIQAPPPP